MITFYDYKLILAWILKACNILRYRVWYSELLGRKTNFNTKAKESTGFSGLSEYMKRVLKPCRTDLGAPAARAGRVPGGTIILSRERTERSRTIPSFGKKKCSECVLKILERLVKEQNGTEGELLEKNGIIVNAFLFSRTSSQLGTHFKSGMCFQFRFSLYVVIRNWKI